MLLKFDFALKSWKEMVNAAELKVKIFRLVDAQDGETLEQVYQLLLERLQAKSQWTSREEGYAAMAADEEREQEAMEWIEGTLNHEEL